MVANPPYMGSSSLGKWMGAWVKKHYPEAYRDLCTSFIDQGFGMSSDNGYSAMVTMQSWMFLGSFEKLRGKILRNHSISSMAHLGTRAFGAIGGEVVSTTATVFANEKSEVKGAYFRLVDMSSEAEKQAGLLEALANPTCSWFYKTDCKRFGSIPGIPIAYWTSKKIAAAFHNAIPLGEIAKPSTGFQTGAAEKFLFMWWEMSNLRICKTAQTREEAKRTQAKWFPCKKGGEYRKWYGNDTWIANWKNDGSQIYNNPGSVIRNPDLYFLESITWTKLSSSKIAVRYCPSGFVFDQAGSTITGDYSQLVYLLAFCNSEIAMSFFSFLSPTMTFGVGEMSLLPIYEDRKNEVLSLGNDCIDCSRNDWVSFEESPEFLRHPLI